MPGARTPNRPVCYFWELTVLELVQDALRSTVMIVEVVCAFLQPDEAFKSSNREKWWHGNDGLIVGPFYIVRSSFQLFAVALMSTCRIFWRLRELDTHSLIWPLWGPVAILLIYSYEVFSMLFIICPTYREISVLWIVHGVCICDRPRLSFDALWFLGRSALESCWTSWSA